MVKCSGVPGGLRCSETAWVGWRWGDGGVFLLDFREGGELLKVKSVKRTWFRTLSHGRPCSYMFIHPCSYIGMLLDSGLKFFFA